jgi:small subunit ribosomal protein S6
MRRRMAAERPVYDLVLLLDPGVEDERREKIIHDAADLIATNGGEIIERHDWGVRGTAYEIRKRADQDYHLIQFHATNPALDALNHTLKITDGVSRYRVIKLRKGTPPAPDLSASTVAASVGGEGSDDDDR